MTTKTLTKDEINWIRKHRERMHLLHNGLIGLFLALIVGLIGYLTTPYITLWALVIFLWVALIITIPPSGIKSIPTFFIIFSIIFMLIDIGVFI